LYHELRKAYQEQGDVESLNKARALLDAQHNISLGDRERLFGFLEGSGRIILPEPKALLTPASKVPGLDGRKMSKSYGNTIFLRDDPVEIERKMRTMPTDPARVRRTDPGDPEKCPVWQFHQLYSADDTKKWVQEGCKTAGIGCIECKRPVIDAVLAEQRPILERAKEFTEDPKTVRSIVANGCEEARAVARETLDEVRLAMGLAYR